MIGKHLRKVEARAARWAERFDPENFSRPPRETIAYALRTNAWMKVLRVEGSLVEADDLIRVVTVDVPELVTEIRALRQRNDILRARLRECTSVVPTEGTNGS